MRAASRIACRSSAVTTRDTIADARALRRVTFGAFLFLSCFYFLLSTGEPPKGDAYAPFTGAIHLIQGKGILASKVMPGQTFLLVPIAAFTQVVVRLLNDDASRWVVLVLTADIFPAAMTAASSAVLLRVALLAGFSLPLALFTMFVFALATPAAVYAKNFFPQPTETFFLLLTIWGLLVARRDSNADVAAAPSSGVRGRRRVPPPLVLSGLAYGALLLVNVVAIAYLPVLAAFVFWLRRDGGGFARLLRFGAPALALALLFLPYNFAARGDAFAFGYAQGRDALWGFASPLATGLHGLLLSPGKGFFYYAPVLVLSIFGARALLSRDRALALLLLGVCGGALLLHARWWAWHGDNAWGPRYLVPALPLASLLAAESLRGMRPRRDARTAAVAALIALSCGIQVLGGAFGNDIYQTTTYDTVIPRYRESHGANGPRDDELHLHWFPEFSPLVGHAWMLSHVVRGDGGAAYLADYPWRALRPDGEWAPRIPEPPPRLDLWVLRLPEKHPSARGLIGAIGVVALAGAIAGAAITVRALGAARVARAASRAA